MADWRIGRGWSEAELAERLDELQGLNRSFAEGPEMDSGQGWRRSRSEAVVGVETAGPPEEEGPFQRGCKAIANYEFSDPNIVLGRFDRKDPLLGRRMLLELRALRFFRYLAGVVVREVREEVTREEAVFGFRYDTLEGHIERGFEWFLLAKDLRTGKIRFRVTSVWQPGEFPNWWSRLGFAVLGRHYQVKWLRRSHKLLAQLIGASSNNDGHEHGGARADATAVQLPPCGRLWRLWSRTRTARWSRPITEPRPARSWWPT
jgi:uncharacterized protein (UPF0548 family)